MARQDLGGVAVIKIVLALSRGHRNILFLIIMTLWFAFIVTRASMSRQTNLGAQSHQ
jgi:hypothetical protein